MIKINNESKKIYNPIYSHIILSFKIFIIYSKFLSHILSYHIISFFYRILSYHIIFCHIMIIKQKIIMTLISLIRLIFTFCFSDFIVVNKNEQKL